MTTRLIQAVQAIGCATSGEGGARLAKRLCIATSPSTILNRLMELPDPAFSPPEEIGLDEWSFRRRKRFGTIIVDLQRHRILDLLPDKESATVARWLKAYPTIRLVSRDRSREFADAIREGAPQAIQVLDRFHLLRNLVDLLPSILARCLAELRRAAKQEEAPRPLEEALPAPLPPPLPDGPWKPPLSRPAEARRLARQAERNARYAQACTLQKAGWTDEAIGKQMGLSLRTVQRWRHSFRTDTHRRNRASEFDRYAAYVRRRWEDGCHNGLTIWGELKAQGYAGSSRMVYRYLQSLRQAVPSPSSGALHLVSSHVTLEAPTAEQMASLGQYTLPQLQWLFVCWPEELTLEERKYLAWLQEAHSSLATIYRPVQHFRRLIGGRAGHELEHWVQQCLDSHIRELARFARGLQAEWEPVVAGLTHPASNGQTEGCINRLKTIKRQMYGRAGFPLLRRRVLHAA